ncbi:MAG: CoA pyrophosphatase [Firmicutes bacterium]|nr:CoA pyrophosphatase [Bacillota bacterium]
MSLLARLREQLREYRPRDLPPHSWRRAAVLVPVFEQDGVAHLLLTKRTETVEHHKGQIAFPGGGEEPGDASLEETALRETYEELGLEPAAVEVLGRLDEVETVVSGFAVTPFVGAVPPPDRLRPNPNEIDEIVTLPLAIFQDPGRVRAERVVRGGRVVELLYYDCGRWTVWGLTARIIRNLLDVVEGKVPEAPEPPAANEP